MKGKNTGNARGKLLSLLVTVFLLILVLSSCFLENTTRNLTVDSSPDGINVIVDNQTVQTPATLPMTAGTHKLQVLTTYKTVGGYAGIDNVKYVFSKWSDGSTSNPRTVSLDSDRSYSAQMSVLYKLGFGSNLSGVSPEASPSGDGGFYPAGSHVVLTAENVPGYIFRNWLINGTVESGSPYTQYMTLPIQATAEYVADLPPNVPTLVYPSDGATNLSNGLTLKWQGTDPNGQSLSYDLYLGKSGTSPQLIESGIQSESYTLTSLDYLTSYKWYVVANNGYKTTQSPVWSFTTMKDPIPSAPGNLHSTSISNYSASLTWNSVFNATGYKIYRSTDGTNYSFVEQTPANSYTDTGLAPLKGYYYKVKAYNTYGESGYSNVINVKTYAMISGTVSVYTGQSAFVSSAIPENPKVNWQISSNDKGSYAPNQVIVGFKKGYGAKSVTAMSAAPFAYKVVNTLETPDQSVNSALIEVATSVERAVAHFKSMPGVAYAEPNYISHALSVTPNDPYYPVQWNLPDIEAPQAWQVTKGGKNVIVAVLDTGVSSTHPDLQNLLVPGYNFVSDSTDTMDNYGHGTHVAGIIAADTNNGIGIAGVDWGGNGLTSIMPVKILDSTGNGSDYWIAEGIVYAVQHGAKVINMSFGGLNYSTAEQNACQYAYDNGVTLVAAAGNDYSNSLEYPAAFSTVIPVAAVGPGNTLAYYSNYTSGVICAPGGAMYYGESPTTGIYSTYYSTSTNTNTYAYLQGTSMAAPHVSGVVALMISQGITGPANIWNIIKDTADNNIGPSSKYGYGLVNAYAAVTYDGGWHPMVVFAEDTSGTHVASATVANNGDFSLKLPIGTYKIYAWQDFNGDGQIDTGDFYGFYGYDGNSTDSPTSIGVAGGETLKTDIYVSPDVTNYSLSSTVVSEVKRVADSAVSAHYRKTNALTF